MQNDATFSKYKLEIEAWLEQWHPQGAPQQLWEAMRYSLLAGGKRLRPILVLEFCRICGGDPMQALPIGCAIEMLHTYSLIHDDLPAMDDDNLRRGKPTCHIKYGEATAILAGDALQSEAFYTILSAQLPGDRLAACAKELAFAAGAVGMCGGQQLDLDSKLQSVSLMELTQLQRLKTGALFRAACRMGVIAAGGTEEQLACAAKYAEALGLAFQIRDDMLDEIADEATLGKPIGSDREQGKYTFLTHLGLSGCEKRIHDLTEQAIRALQPLDQTQALEQLVLELATRQS